MSRDPDRYDVDVNDVEPDDRDAGDLDVDYEQPTATELYADAREIAAEWRKRGIRARPEEFMP